MAHNSTEVHIEDLEYDPYYDEIGNYVAHNDDGYDQGNYDEGYYAENEYNNHEGFHEYHEGEYDENGVWIEGTCHQQGQVYSHDAIMQFEDNEHFQFDDENVNHEGYDYSADADHRGGEHYYGRGYDQDGNEIISDNLHLGEQDMATRNHSLAVPNNPQPILSHVASVDANPEQVVNVPKKMSSGQVSVNEIVPAPVPQTSKPSTPLIPTAPTSSPSQNRNSFRNRSLSVHSNGSHDNAMANTITDATTPSSSRKVSLTIEDNSDAKKIINHFQSPVHVRLGVEELSPMRQTRKSIDIPQNVDAEASYYSLGSTNREIRPAEATAAMAESRPSSTSSKGSRKSSKVSPMVSNINAMAPPPKAPVSITTQFPNHSIGGSGAKFVSPKQPENTSSNRLSAKTATTDSSHHGVNRQAPGGGHVVIVMPTNSPPSSGAEDNSTTGGSGVALKKDKSKMMNRVLSSSLRSNDSDASVAIRKRRVFLGNKTTTTFLNAVCIAATPNPVAFVASADSSVIVFDLTTGEQIHSLTSHSDRVLCLATSIPGEVYFTKAVPPSLPRLQGRHFLVSGGRDENICIWDAETFKNLHIIHAHKGPVWSVAAVIVGNIGYVISSSNAGAIRIWDASTGEKLFNLKGQKDKVLSLSILDCRSPVVHLISCGEDKKIHIWDIVAGRHVKMLEGHEDEVTSVTSGNFRQLGSMQSIETATKATMKASDNIISLIVSGSRDKSVRVWDWQQGIQLFVLAGHLGAIFGVSIGLTQRNCIKCASNTPLVISGSDDGSVIIWSLETGKAVKELKGHVNSIKGLSTAMIDSSPVVNHDKEMIIVTCGWDKTTHFMDADESISTEDAGCKCSIM